MTITDTIHQSGRSESVIKPGMVTPSKVLSTLEQHILVDGFKLIFDVDKSSGSYFVDASSGREFIDLYGFYASQPIGYNHPHFSRAAIAFAATPPKSKW